MNTSSSPLASRAVGALGKSLNYLYASKSFAIITLTGAVAFMAGFRIAISGDTVGEEMFNAWMIDWAVIWASLAVVSLLLLRPMVEYFSQDQDAQQEAMMFRELIRLEPAMAQELQAMAMHQQYRDEMKAEKEQAELVAAKEALAQGSSTGMPARRLADRLVSAH